MRSYSKENVCLFICLIQGSAKRSGKKTKRLLRVHTVSHKRDYWWKFVVCLQSSILHPKNTKFGKSDVFKSLEIA